MPKISVVVPVYKAERYIERCCRSLFAQTLDDIEYVFVDDCSPDRSIGILKSVLEEFPQRKGQVRFLRNPKNLGTSLTRQKGIKATTGEYVVHCDADDCVDVTAYEKMYHYAKDKNLDIVACEFYKIDDNGNTRHIKEPTGRDVIELLLTGQRQGALWNRIVKGDIVRSENIMNPMMDMCEDLVFVLQYYHYANSVGDLHEALYYYYRNSDSVSSSRTFEELLGQLKQVAVNLETVENFFRKNNLLEKYAQEIVARKFFNKSCIVSSIYNLKICRYWLRLHPDINLSLYTCPYLSVKDKIISLLIELRLYPLVRTIKHRRH